ncbi:hypothetical protein CBR_g28654 [Chara braunii]|uniref:Adenylyl-sulfate kinase n=1 Tax=Chara braunii TaxID=69332 RepID=A0A388L9H5_CHABU|nr:hypothetical protein CBR_g28654 [Chara braunii]|eukprot:GBG78938.1 hypothetical protein CBR_g28654 [Chara braunii]
MISVACQLKSSSGYVLSMGAGAARRHADESCRTSVGSLSVIKRPPQPTIQTKTALFGDVLTAKHILTRALLSRRYCNGVHAESNYTAASGAQTHSPSPAPVSASAHPPAPAPAVNSLQSATGNTPVPNSSPTPADRNPVTNIKWNESQVSRRERERVLNQRGCIVWLTGLSGSGKSTVAYALDYALASRGKISYVLDGDIVRDGLNKNLGFSREDRAENIRRIGEVAKLFVDAGIITLVSLISPYREDRDRCRAMFPAGDFIEVYMKVPLSVCERRDAKGLYRLARSGQLKGFTGIDDPYECPLTPEITMEVRDDWGTAILPQEMAERVASYLEERGFFTAEGN